MGSSFIRALGDKAVEKQALSNRHSAASLYKLATKIDPQNWRARKGMAQTIYDNRYYTIDMEEKVKLAMVEREWFEQAYQNNQKDPEILSGLGKCLLFLGRSVVRSQESEVRDRRITNFQPPTSNLQAKGLNLLREACRYRKFNDAYWWTLGVELRKAERYEEALEVFQYMETIKRTPSSRKNIAWIEDRLQALASGQEEENISGVRRELEDHAAFTEDGVQEVESTTIDIDEMFELDSKPDAEKNDGLSELLKLMGQ